MNTYTVRDVRDFSYRARSSLEFVSAVLIERSSIGLVFSYPTVYAFVRDLFALKWKITGNLLRRPLFFFQKPQGFPFDTLAYAPIPTHSFFANVRIFLRSLRVIALSFSVLLRAISREIVLGETSSCRAISERFNPARRNAEISYLCCRFSCLYIAN